MPGMSMEMDGLPPGATSPVPALCQVFRPVAAASATKVTSDEPSVPIAARTSDWAGLPTAAGVPAALSRQPALNSVRTVAATTATLVRRLIAANVRRWRDDRIERDRKSVV